ncbi:MAG: toll/interleukin-1 receptor domain-containing protein [Chloroflexota bacterium]
MKFDVFLSHNSKDKPAIEQLAHKLEAKGLKVWLDKWNLIPGDPWQEDLEEALDESQTIAVFVGPHNISPWENEEMRAAIEERVQDKSRRVIPVLLPGAPDNKTLKLPRFLKRLTWVDLRVGLDNEDAFYRLECGIRGIAPGKPATAETKPSSSSEENPLVGDLPIGSYLPFPPNPLFEGRIADLHKLAESLLNHTNTGTVINQTITGMGGIGKTQLAVEFAYRYGRYYRGVHWLNLADPTQLESEIARCGSQMGLANFPADQPSQVTLTLHTWKSDRPRLLILDNFEDPALVNNILRYLGHSALRLLITSRRSDWLATTGLHPIPLDVFSAQESLEFLKRALTKRKDADEDLNRLGERLGYLPLGLELASRYLNDHPRLKIAEYLEQAQQALEHPSMNAWHKDMLGLTPTQHDTSLLSTFALSWLALSGGSSNPESKSKDVSRPVVEGKNETAQKIFQTAGYLAPNTAIPLEIFEKALKISTEICDENLSMLYGLGLLRESENNQPAVHPLLAEYARSLSQENSKVLESLTDTLVTLSNEANKTGLPSRFIPLRAHMPILAAHAENAKLDSAGTLWNNYGYHLTMIADYSGARAAYEHALIAKHDNAIYINNLAGVQYTLGDLPGARTAFERALKIDEAIFGTDHPNVATDVNNLGMVLQDLGDLPGARAAFERALKIDEATFGTNHPNVAIRVNNLGDVMRMQGDLPGARAAFERALKIDEANFGPDHPKVATEVNNLGIVMRYLGDLPGARAAYERALKIFEKQLGEDHPNVAALVNNLGSVLQALGDLPGARAAFERAIKIWEANLGTEHPQVAIGVNNLGGVLKDLGDLPGARAAFERAIKIFEQFLPADHPNIKIVQGNLDSLE